tara:strand:- start:1598 stop:1720 length:123 start_codon:yes stop_codon:yes gene_type:complete
MNTITEQILFEALISSGLWPEEAAPAYDTEVGKPEAGAEI